MTFLGFSKVTKHYEKQPQSFISIIESLNFTLRNLKHQEHRGQVQVTIIFYGNWSSYETRHFSLFLSCTKHKCYRLTPYNCILNSILTIMLNIRDILKSYSRRFNVYVETISKIDTEPTCISHAKINILYFVNPSFRIRQRAFEVSS